MSKVFERIAQALERLANVAERREERYHDDRTAPPDKPCTVDGCNRKAVARGLCNAHYQRLMLKGGTLNDMPVGFRRNKIKSEELTDDSTSSGSES